MGKLKNSRHERFCHEYIKDGNATQAYLRVGYSKNGARQSAQRLLTNADIQERIAELQHKSNEKCIIERDWIIQKLKRAVEYGAQEIESGGSFKLMDYKAITDAAKELSKLNGFYEPEQVEHNHVGQIEFTIVKPE